MRVPFIGIKYAKSTLVEWRSGMKVVIALAVWAAAAMVAVVPPVAKADCVQSYLDGAVGLDSYIAQIWEGQAKTVAGVGGIAAVGAVASFFAGGPKGLVLALGVVTVGAAAGYLHMSSENSQLQNILVLGDLYQRSLQQELAPDRRIESMWRSLLVDAEIPSQFEAQAKVFLITQYMESGKACEGPDDQPRKLEDTVSSLKAWYQDFLPRS